MKATVHKQKQGRGKQASYVVKVNGRKHETFKDNGKLGKGSARDLAQTEARRLNGGRSL